MNESKPDPIQKSLSCLPVVSESRPSISFLGLLTALHPEKVLEQPWVKVFVPAVGTGIVVTAIFHPLDRGFYKALTEGRKLSSVDFKGGGKFFWQSLLAKGVTSSAYFVCQDEAKKGMHKIENRYVLSPVLSKILLGVTIGVPYAFFCHPFSVSKYYGYSSDHPTIRAVVRCLHEKAGMNVFFRGLSATIYRDVLFAIIYESLRAEISKHQDKWIANFLAATAGAAITAPLNIMRLEIFNHPPEKTISNREVFSKLLERSREGSRFRIGLFFSNCRLGYATTRAGAGVALGQATYDALAKLM